MKKILLLAVLIATTLGVFAQSDQGQKSVVFQLGAKSNPARFMLGAEGRYSIVDDIRVAPSAYLVFPKDKTTGLDIDVNFHYVYGLDVLTPGLSVYPLAGISMQNARYSGGTINGKSIGSNGYTNWGFNLGAGFDYDITNTSFMNFEMKYTFSDADCFNVFVGYGFKF